MDIPHEASWCWRNILGCRTAACSLISHSIGDGNDTFLWKDPWHPQGILMNKFPQHFLYHSQLHKNARVKALIRDNSWDSRSPIRSAVEGLHDDLHLVEIDSRFKDEVVWNGGYDAVFTNKSAYHAIRPHSNPVPWAKLVWFKGRVPRHSFIAWLALHRAMKTQDKLVKWKKLDRSLCILCSDDFENEEHMFFECRYSRSIWSAMLQYMGYNHQPLGLTDECNWCLTHFAGKAPSTMVKKIALNATIYHIWAERNRRRFQHKHMSTTEVIAKILADVRLRASVLDLLVDDNADSRRFFEQWRIDVRFCFNTGTLHQWIKPESGWVKINSDGSFVGNRGGYGAIIRDHNGEVVAAAAGSQVGCSVTLHELQGVELGLKLAQQYGLQKIQLCMDSKNVFTYLTTSRAAPREARHTTRRIKRAITQFADCKIMHTFRETNQVADKLAKLLPSHVFLEITPSSFAEDVKKIIFDDARGRKYKRM